MNYISNTKLLYESVSTLLSNTKENIKKQLKKKYGQKKLREWIKSGLIINDEYDIRRYALLEDENKNFILLTTGCNEEDNGEKKLPDIEQLSKEFEKGGLFEDAIEELKNKQKMLLFAYLWAGENPQMEMIESDKIYDSIVDKDYFTILSTIENEA